MLSSIPRRWTTGAVLLLAAGCTDVPTTPLDGGTDMEPPPFSVAVTCRVRVASGDMSCAPAAATASGVQANLVVGSQHQFVRMANDPPTMEAGTWSADVTVQNLTLQPMATLDGTTAAEEGVRVFFVDEPSNGVTIDDYGAEPVTGTEPQKHYAYAGADLGADGLLASGETSAARTWQFTLNGATEFTFSVLIATDVPDPSAYSVQLSNLQAGSYSTCAEGSDARIYCWGSNRYGEVGRDPEAGDALVPVSVDAPDGVTLSGLGYDYGTACAAGSDGNAYCWGRGANGALGNGAEDDSFTPVAVSAPTGVELSNFDAGDMFVCADGSDDQLYCWGLNHRGQLGDGSITESRPVPGAVLAPDGVSLSAPSAGASHVCADGSDGKIYCWGRNNNGQLGDGSGSEQSTVPVQVDAPDGVTLSGVQAGFRHTCALDADGNGYCWGDNLYGQLGDGSTDDQPTPVPVTMPEGVAFTRIATGQYTTCGEATDGRVFCWGRNNRGLLADGGTTDSSVPVEVIPPAGVTLSRIDIGYYHACAESASGPEHCWGDGRSGVLGDGAEIQNSGIVPVAGTR